MRSSDAFVKMCSSKCVHQNVFVKCVRQMRSSKCVRQMRSSKCVRQNIFV